MFNKLKFQLYFQAKKDRAPTERRREWEEVAMSYAGTILGEKCSSMTSIFLVPNQATFLSPHDKYSTKLTINDKNVDVVLVTWTHGGRMVGADESTELCQHSNWICVAIWIMITFSLLAMECNGTSTILPHNNTNKLCNMKQLGYHWTKAWLKTLNYRGL